MSEWKPIESAPRDGTLVELRSAKHWPGYLWNWSKREKRWETEVFLLGGKSRAWWGKSAEQPTHWKPIDEVKK